MEVAAEPATEPAGGITLRAFNSEYRLEQTRAARDPQGAFDEAMFNPSHVGIYKLFNVPGVASHVLVTRSSKENAKEWRLLSTAEVDAFLALDRIEAVHPYFMRARLLSPEADEVLAALIEVDAKRAEGGVGTTELVESKMRRCARKEAAVSLGRGSGRASAACGVDSRRTDGWVKKAGMLRNLHLSLSADGIQFGLATPSDAGGQAAFDHVLARADAQLRARSLDLHDYRLLNTTVSIAACREQGIVDGDEVNSHVAGRVSTQLIELTSAAIDQEPVVLFSIAHPRTDVAAPRHDGSPPPAQSGGHHRDVVYMLVHRDVLARRGAHVRDIGFDGVEEKHGVIRLVAQTRLVARMAALGMTPCADCHGDKQADATAARDLDGDLAALRAGGAEAERARARWCSPQSPELGKRAFDAFVCKCAHAKTQRAIARRLAPVGGGTPPVSPSLAKRGCPA